VNWNNEANLFYRNESGISFTEIGASVGIAGLEKSKSACWGDFDNDGDQDLYVVNWLDQPNKFYRNDTQSCFTEIGSIAGIADEGYGNGASWCDYDNDGYLDLLLVTWIEDSNLLFRNSGDGTFEDFSHIAGIDDIPIARSISICDYNNDGFIDCYVSVDAGENIFYQNTLSNNNWLKLTLEGNLSNRSAIGTNVTIQSGRLIRSFSINSGEGYMSGNSLTLDMGLGSLEMLDQIDVNWPSGMQNTLYNVSCCQHLIITEDVILSTPESISIQIENDQITISWDEVTGANSYIVYRSSNVDGIFTQISGSLNEFTIDGYRVSWSGAIQDTKGFYYVKASTDNWYMNVGKKDNQRQK